MRIFDFKVIKEKIKKEVKEMMKIDRVNLVGIYNKVSGP